VVDCYSLDPYALIKLRVSEHGTSSVQPREIRGPTPAGVWGRSNPMNTKGFEDRKLAERPVEPRYPYLALKRVGETLEKW